MEKNNFFFTHVLRVRYAEVDAQGIVFNAHYLTYFDCAITEYYRKIKYNYISDVKNNQKDFHVIKTTTEYKKPILFDQLIDVCTKVSRIGRSSLIYDLAIYPNKKKKLLAYAQIIQVYTDQLTNKSAELPKKLIRQIKVFEKIL